jgi:hypothetical protein
MRAGKAAIYSIGSSIIMMAVLGLLLPLVGFVVTAHSNFLEIELGSGRLDLIEGKRLTKVAHDLAILQEEYKTHRQLQSPGIFQPSNPNLRVIENRVVIDAVASGDAKVLLADLKALGLKRGAAFGRMVSGELPIDAIDDLNALDSLKFVRPVYTITNTGAGRQLRR